MSALVDALLGALSHDVALDLGTSRTRLWVRGEGLVFDQPTLVAVRTWRAGPRKGERQIVAIGDEAMPLLGRAPEHIEVVRPVRAGHVARPDVLRAVFVHLFRQVHGRRSGFAPRVLALTEPDAPAEALATLKRALREAGAGPVTTAPKPVAALLGGGLTDDDPTGRMVIDLGGGTCQISVLSQGRVITTCTLDLGGEVLQGALHRCLRRDHALTVGPHTLRRLLLSLQPPPLSLGAHLTSAILDPPLPVSGRCLRRGLPRSTTVDRTELLAALEEPLAALGAGVRRVLEQTPPQLADDIASHGVLLVGGAAQVATVAEHLTSTTGLAILEVDQPALAAITGARTLLERRTPRAWLRRQLPARHLLTAKA